MSATTEVVLAREGEYRVEVPPQTEVGVRLKSGSAELFGVELAIDREYTFRDRKLAIFTWYGCTLERTGQGKHAAGPRVLVCGPVDSGKSTLTHILANYALRLGEKPTLVELDVGHGCLSVPGTLSASPLDMNSLSIEEDFILTNPLAFFYGHAAASENVELFRYQQQQLAKAVKRRLANDEEVNASGCVINTCGWVDGMGFDLLLHAIKEFEVDRQVSRSGGVVPLNSKLRSAARISCIREYFYGAHSLSVAISTLSPCINEFSFDDVSFYMIKDMKVSDVMLPVGQVETQSDRLRVVPVEKTADLGHSLAAVAHPQHGQDARFVFIKEVRVAEQKLVLLVPSPGPLPSRNLLLGSIKWME
ncbi:hypothetical protein KRP22_015251 [Phytophthora ramorum]|nr:Protein CLP1-like protein [Phytophthora ramorum]